MTPTTQAVMATAPTEADALAATAKMGLATKFIMRHQAFFATLLLGLVKKEIPDRYVASDGSVIDGTMGTDGTDLRYAVQFVLDSSQGKVTFVVLHEILHVVFKHHLRRGDRNPAIWNNAADFVINAHLVRMGLYNSYFTDENFRECSREWLQDYCTRNSQPEYTMPEDGLLDPKYLGLSTDEVYDILWREQKQQPDPEDQPDAGSGSGGDAGGDTGGNAGGDAGDDAGGDTGGDAGENTDDEGDGDEDSLGDCPWGNVTDATDDEGNALTQGELADAERELNRAIVSAANIAKGRGQLPSYLGDQVTELVAPSRDWREILEDMLADTVPTDYSFETPNRFHLRSPIVMPSNDREGLGHVGIFVDASGSVSQGEYRQFMSDVADIFENLNPETATMIQFDCTAAEPETFEAGEEPDYVRRRNGGTHFPAPFDKAAEDGLLDDFDVIIVFTDGGDDSFPEEPNCPVIWASTGAFWGGTPPFGECVAVKFDD